MSSGVPHWCTLPSLMTAMRSDIVSASSWSCVTKTNVMPTSRWMRLSSTCIALRSLRSNAASGSSSSSTEGRLTSARQGDALPLATGQRARLVLVATGQLDQFEHLADTPCHLGFSDPAAAQSECDVLPDGQVVEERVALEDGVDVAPVRRQVGDVLAVQRHFAVAR